MYYRQNQPEYAAWRAMRQRCMNHKHRFYHRYGGRGIVVCERWDSFDNFLADMGPRPDGASLERENNDGPYAPGNCVWATHATQCRNRSSSRVIEYDGMSLCLQEWADRLGLNKRTLRERLERGWSVERALTEPLQSQFSNRKNREDQTSKAHRIRRIRPCV